MIQIKSFVFNPFMENTYILYDDTRECIIIDPGCYEKSESQTLQSFIEQNQLKVKLLINTHCHVDHVLGNAFVKDLFKVDLLIHQLDLPTLQSVQVYAPGYGFPLYQSVQADAFLAEGDKVKFGHSELDVLFVPGHAPGHIALVDHDQNICIGGDVLFQGSIGRTDLPGGDYHLLIQSIKTKMFKLQDKVVVYPGHGPATTIGEEKLSNPFVGTI
ncbi:MAG: MBL fold metallo-hydrolase [Candidatus Cyclobacteriaceae bacterium M3_2C_046]